MIEKLININLDNGLNVILKELHSAPIISQWLWYRVGSRNETEGLTGISHWVEHMQFKGTTKFPAGILDQAISRDGGYWNAFTYMDWTAFFATMPAAKIDLPIELEADRMRNCLYLPEEVESERTVVISELEGQETDPMSKLSKAVGQAAFFRHPYGREVIGEKADLKRITRDDLYGHYQSHYLPNNAVLCLAGDFEASAMLKKIETVYGKIKPGTVPPCNVQPEGAIPAAKTIEVHGPCEVSMMQLVWRAPAGRDADIYPLTIFDSVLSGPSSLNMFGGGSISNRSSRLYKALVDSGIAAAMGGGYTTTIDPYLYTITLYLNEGHDAREALEVIDAEIARIAGTGITAEELEKALKQARAMFAYSSENITNQAYWMGYTCMFDESSWFERFVPALEKVTPDDVSRIARDYFSPEKRVTGIYSGEL